MRFLVDNQLPPALAKWLGSRGHEARHVLDIGLDAVTDTQVWNYAAEHSFALITKDEDFFARTLQPGAAVQVVWVRLGNCRTRVLLAVFDAVLPQVIAALEKGDPLVEIR